VVKHTDKLRAEIETIRKGHLTGGYCDTEILVEAERKLFNALNAEIHDLGNTPEHNKRRAELEKEIRGLAYRPKLVPEKEDKKDHAQLVPEKEDKKDHAH